MPTPVQIIATIGPASATQSMLESMIESGMNLARFNFSWGTHEEHAKQIELVRAAAAAKHARILLVQDLSGPRVQKDHEHTFDPTSTALTQKDLDDLQFGIESNVDYVALSFVAHAQDVERLRRAIHERGGTQKIIAKIERKEALEHIDDIINAADAVMIARGDLGEVVPLEQIPFIQQDIVTRARAVQKPVIVATQMLLSMTEHDEPTRAEVTDVTYAALEGVDAVMLSEETSMGKYPKEAVLMMQKILHESALHAPTQEKHSL